MVFRAYSSADQAEVKEQMDKRARQLCRSPAEVRLGEPSTDRLYIVSDTSKPDAGREYHASIRCFTQ